MVSDGAIAIAETEAGEQAPDQHGSKKSAFQKRVDGLTRARFDAERLANDLRGQVEKLERQLSQKNAEIAELDRALKFAGDTVAKYKARLFRSTHK